MKDYKIESEPLASKYKQPCMLWYKARHVALMDGTPFDQPMPPKDWEERLNQTKQQIVQGSQILGSKL